MIGHKGNKPSAKTAFAFAEYHAYLSPKGVTAIGEGALTRQKSGRTICPTDGYQLHFVANSLHLWVIEITDRGKGDYADSTGIQGHTFNQCIQIWHGERGDLEFPTLSEQRIHQCPGYTTSGSYEERQWRLQWASLIAHRPP